MIRVSQSINLLTPSEKRLALFALFFRLGWNRSDPQTIFSLDRWAGNSNALPCRVA